MLITTCCVFIRVSYFKYMVDVLLLFCGVLIVFCPRYRLSVIFVVFLLFDSHVVAAMNTGDIPCCFNSQQSICCFPSCLRWTRREQADFYRTVSSFGVVYDTDVKAFDWSQFRVLARLERKTDESLERYFNSFVNMCRTACKLPPRKDEGKNAWLFFFNYQILEIPLFFHIRNSWQQHILLSDIRFPCWCSKTPK